MSLFKEFFSSYKVDRIYKYVELIDEILVDDSPIEIDFKDFSEEIQKLFALYQKDMIHNYLHKAIIEVLQVKIGSSVSGLRGENNGQALFLQSKS